jgi:hypothetical protein
LRGVFLRVLDSFPRLRYRPQMPRSDVRTLSDIREPTITIVCAPCGRRGRYKVHRLMVQYADEKMPDLLATLADCHQGS